MKRTLLKQLLVVCVAVLCCATVSVEAEGAANCTVLNATACCDPSIGDGCGLCSNGTSELVCQTNDTCTADLSQCASEEKCTGADNTTCCADEMCGWCSYNETAYSCQLLMTKTCNKTVSTCEATVVDCASLTNVSDCCAHQEECAWCEGPTAGQKVCQKVSERTCNTTADTCVDVQCQSLKSDKCCDDAAFPDCGWCMLNDKTPGCRSLKSDSCNKTGDQCGDLYCQNLTETACCGEGASKDCGWCKLGDTPTCRSLLTEECNSTLNQCGAFYCESLDETQCCNDTIAPDCGLCPTENNKTCQLLGTSTCNGTLDTCSIKKCGDLNQSECCSDDFRSKCGWCDNVCRYLDDAACGGSQNECEKPVDFCPTLTKSEECCANSSCGWCANQTVSSCYSRNDTQCQAGPNDCDSSTTFVPVTSPAPVTSSPAPSTGGQHFDAASFIGGIVLAAGIFGIGLFAYKYYASKKANNYHTL